MKNIEERLEERLGVSSDYICGGGIYSLDLPRRQVRLLGREKWEGRIVILSIDEKEKLKKRLLDEFYNSPVTDLPWSAYRVLTYWPDPWFDVEKIKKQRMSVNRRRNDKVEKKKV